MTPMRLEDVQVADVGDPRFASEPLALVEFFAPWLVFTEATPGIHNLRLQ